MRHAAERKASIDPVSEIGTVQGPLMERRHELNGRHRLLIRGAAPVCNLVRSEEHTSELQSLMRISYAVFCLKKKRTTQKPTNKTHNNNSYTVHTKQKCTTKK